MLPPRPALTMTGFEGCDLDRQHVLNAHAHGRVIPDAPWRKDLSADRANERAPFVEGQRGTSASSC